MLQLNAHGDVFTQTFAMTTTNQDVTFSEDSRLPDLKPNQFAIRTAVNWIKDVEQKARCSLQHKARLRGVKPSLYGMHSMSDHVLY